MISRIETALSSIGLNVFDHFFDNTKKYKNASGTLITIDEYITYTVVSETPVTYADNIDDYTEILVDVDCFTQNKTNAESYKLRIRDALRDAGYTIEETVIQFENDTRYYHTTVSISDVEKTEVYVAPTTED